MSFRNSNVGVHDDDDVKRGGFTEQKVAYLSCVFANSM